MAKEVSDWTGETYYQVMNHSAIEVIGTLVVMRQKAELMK